MRFLLLFVFVLSLSAEKVLVINSNSNVEKYQCTLDGFKQSYKKPFSTIDIATMKHKKIREYLYDEYPDVIYAIGSKAYQYAYKYLPEKKILFSSIVNWKRLPVRENHYGIANELHSGVHLTLIKSIFSDIKKIGIVYSKYTQDVYESFQNNAAHMGIKIISKKIENIKDINFNTFLKKSEAFIMLPDPVLLQDKNSIENLFKISKKLKKPIFAYDELFIEYGAVLVLSVDNPTIGRQAAVMVKNITNDKKIQKVQFPIGSTVIFNKKIANEMGIKFHDRILLIVNKIIE